MFLRFILIQKMPASDIFFTDRIEAGGMLADLLRNYEGQHSVVFAMTRGGVPVGKQIALALHCPLKPLIIRKIGHPYSPEYAIGAIAEDGTMAANKDELLSVSQKWLKLEVRKQKLEIEKRKRMYGHVLGRYSLMGKVAIVVDDGVATGLSMLAAIKYIKKLSPVKIIVAVPVVPKDIFKKIRKEVDEFVAVGIPEYYLGAVGAYYRDFAQVSDNDVKNLLT